MGRPSGILMRVGTKKTLRPIVHFSKFMYLTSWAVNVDYLKAKKAVLIHVSPLTIMCSGTLFLLCILTAEPAPLNT